ncbi:Uncharacterized protein DAT39_019218, partial [Clarias magur]
PRSLILKHDTQLELTLGLSDGGEARQPEAKLQSSEVTRRRNFFFRNPPLLWT